MFLAGHTNAGYLNESCTCSRDGAHIFLSEDEPMPRLNGPILTIAEIINFFMSSATEAELAVIFITTKKMVPFRQTLPKMCWPQSPSPLLTDNSTAAGVTNNTIMPCQTKSMDMRFYWLRCRASQYQFHFYWDPQRTQLGRLQHQASPATVPRRQLPHPRWLNPANFLHQFLFYTFQSMVTRRPLLLQWCVVMSIVHTIINTLITVVIYHELHVQLTRGSHL